MRDFHHQRFNVLLCSTIIETGIDVPTANTILINRADRFGLAQLHQLRGRVGRSHHQAYAYLLVDSKEGLTAQAKKRLEAIQAMDRLGTVEDAWYLKLAPFVDGPGGGTEPVVSALTPLHRNSNIGTRSPLTPRSRNKTPPAPSRASTITRRYWRRSPRF